MGRNGDTLLAHITPAEARLLDAVTDGGSVNPTTGLLEFWGRMGGSKYSREQRAEAEARAASPSGNTENNTHNDGGGSRQKTYPDSQLAGAARANEEAACTREKVRNYLGRNGASGTDSAITRADARAPQQANASQPAEPTRPREQDTNAAATLTRHYAATTLHENPNAGLLTQKSTPAPSANRYTAATPAPKPALSSSMQRAQNAATAAATAETATTTATAATAPMAPGADPRLSPSATPAQQARNITQARRFTEQQRAAEANANAVAVRTRQNVSDYLGKAQSTRPPTTATRRAHATIPQGGTWLDSVQAQTGYSLTPAANIVKEKRSWLEPAWDTGVTIGQTWDEIKDRALNPNRNHMFDEEQTNMSPAEALTGPAQYGGTKLLSGGAAIGSNTLKNPVGSILGIVSDILDYFAEQQKRDYLEPRPKTNKK